MLSSEKLAFVILFILLKIIKLLLDIPYTLGKFQRHF